jgi:arsenical pump membrane protein
MEGLGAFSILAMTVGIALGRPRIGAIQLHHSHAAVLGAGLCLASGLVPLSLGVHALSVLSFPLLTIVSLMVMTLIAERLGLFGVLAKSIATAARGDGRRLFRYLFFSGAVTGAFFTNDAAVLVFTPLAHDLIEEIQTSEWETANKIPYYFAVLFVANLVGALAISNPINVIVASLFQISFLEYAAWMLLPATVSVLASYYGLLWFFRADIPARYLYSDRPVKQRGDGKPLGVCAAILLLTMAGFFTGGLTGAPTWGVAVAGAVCLALLYGARSGASLMPILRGVAWDVIVFVAGIFIVAYGLRASGLTAQVGELIRNLAGHAVLQLSTTTAMVAAFCSALMNNHPTANIMAMVIDDFKLATGESKMLALAALIGGDLGPKMLPIGSLAALMWFRLLCDRGVQVSYWLYIKIGVPVTLGAILLSVATLNLEYWLWNR